MSGELASAYKKNKNVYKKIIGGTNEIIDSAINGSNHFNIIDVVNKDGKIVRIYLDVLDGNRVSKIVSINTEKNVQQFNFVDNYTLVYIDEENNLRYFKSKYFYGKNTQETQTPEKIINNVNFLFKDTGFSFAEPYCFYLKSNKVYALNLNNAIETHLATNLTNITGFTKGTSKIYGIYA